MLDVVLLAPVRATYERAVLQHAQRRHVHITEDPAALSWGWALGTPHIWLCREHDPGSWVNAAARHAVETCVVSGPPAIGSSRVHAWRVENLRQALAALTREQREVVVLRLSGLTVKATAFATGNSGAAVLSLLRRAHLRMRFVLTELPPLDFTPSTPETEGEN